MTSSKQLSVIDRARLYVAEIPGAISGSGGHPQTFAVTCALIHGFALNESDAMTLLQEYNLRCQPAWTEKELAHKIRSAINGRHEKPRGHLLGKETPVPAMKPPSVPAKQSSKPVDPLFACEYFLKGFQCEEADFWEASPIRPPEDWTKDGALMVAMLYGQTDKVNVVVDFTVDTKGKTKPKGFGVTLPRDEMIRTLQRGELLSDAGGWLRMNPLDGHGINDANVTFGKFALLEFDALPLSVQFSMLGKLPLPIAAILTSGGRSVHAWLRVESKDKAEYDHAVPAALDALSRFGADPKNKNISRLSRLPGVTRIIGADAEDPRQRLIYLNPDATQKPIFQ